MKTRTRQKLFIGLGVAGVIILLIMLALSGGNLALLKSLFTNDLSNEELSQQLKGFGWRGYTVVTALATLQVVCAFLPAEPVQVLGGFTFGFPIGLLCCMLGVLLGNTLIYMLQKIFGDRLRGFFVKKLNLDLEKIARSSKATLIIFILYFLPAIPYGMICFLAASMGMSYRRYITVTGLGSLPSVCIGVGLGYMTLATDAVISLCVFGGLIFLVAIMAWKKDFFFSKLNGFADKHKKAASFTVKPVNSLLMDILYFGARAFLRLRGVRLKTVNKIGTPETGSIILCNHGSFIDFIYAVALLRKSRPHFIVARLYFYHKYLRALLQGVGAFPKSMFAMDMENAKNCLTVLKNKEMLAMMPEARLSTAGRFEDIQESTYGFIKKSGVTVYSVKIGGAYLADPKWGKGFRRGSVVEAELDILFTADAVKNLSIEELKAGIKQQLFYDEFAWLQARPDIHYRAKNLAEGLENILTLCPVCGKRHSIFTRKNQIFCSHCGYLTALDDRYGFTKDFRFQNFGQWYDYQVEITKNEILSNEGYTLTSAVELRLPGDGNALTRHAGRGVCSLTREGLTYTGTKDGEAVTLFFPISKIYRLLFGAGENFEIYDGTKIHYFVPEEKRSAVDWYIVSKILYDLTQ